MATKYLSEHDLPYLEQRIADIFAEKPIVAQFTLETSDWESDSATGKYKCSVAIDPSTGITSNSVGDVSLNLNALSTVAARITVSEAVADSNVCMLSVSTVSGSMTMVFYADTIPETDIPLVLKIIGEMPS